MFAVHGCIELLLYTFDAMDVEIKCSENPTDYAVVYFGTLCSQIVRSSCSKIYILRIVNTIDYIYFCLTYTFINNIIYI